MALKEEVFEGLAGDSHSNGQFAENLFDQLHHNILFLLQKYQVSGERETEREKSQYMHMWTGKDEERKVKKIHMYMYI